MMTTALPECPLGLRAFPSDVREKCGGAAELVGVDLEASLPKSVTDHPWVGCKITFPLFVDDGFVDGLITRCIVHPLGKLMFDVDWPEPVPWIHGHGYRGKLGWEVVLRDDPESYHRYFGNEIAELVKKHPQRKSADGTS